MRNMLIVTGVVSDSGVDHEVQVILSNKAYLEDLKKVFKVVSRIESAMDFNESYIVSRCSNKDLKCISGVRLGDPCVWTILYPRSVSSTLMVQAFTGGFWSTHEFVLMTPHGAVSFF